MQCKITPEMFWQFRYAQLGGKSAVNGAELPKTLAECNPKVQADHYAQACYAMAHYEVTSAVFKPTLNASDVLLSVPIPPLVDAEAASKVRHDVFAKVFMDLKN